MKNLILLLVSASLCFTQGSRLVSAPRVTPTPRPRPSPAPRPLFVEPTFLIPPNPDVNDYRPVVNAEGTTVIFERHRTSAPNDIKLYSLDLSTGDVQPFVTFASTRADWCWDRSGGQLRSGPVAFSNNNGIWTVATGGQPVRLHNTAGMVYPSWYPDCEHLAVDVTGPQVTAEIDATTGIQHPKWFPPREDGKTLLIAAVQAPGQPFRIATFDVSLFVGGAH